MRKSGEFMPAEQEAIKGLFGGIRKAMADEKAESGDYSSRMMSGFSSWILYGPVTDQTIRGNLDTLAGWLSEGMLTKAKVVELATGGAGGIPPQPVDRRGFLVRGAPTMPWVNLSVLHSRIRYGVDESGAIGTFVYGYHSKLFIPEEHAVKLHRINGHMAVQWTLGNDPKEGRSSVREEIVPESIGTEAFAHELNMLGAVAVDILRSS